MKPSTALTTWDSRAVDFDPDTVARTYPSATRVDAGPPTDRANTSTTRKPDRDSDFSAYMAGRQPVLYRTAYLLAGDHASAEDLLQSAFAKLYLSWDRVRDRGALDGYVRRIMVNENNSLWRRAWKCREHPTDTMPETGARPSYDDGLGGALWSCVLTLPPRQRSVVALRYFEQLSEAETADALGISVGTVKSQTSRALAGLRTRARRSLNPHESGDER